MMFALHSAMLAGEMFAASLLFAIVSGHRG
jgi:hypothetical protein